MPACTHHGRRLRCCAIHPLKAQISILQDSSDSCCSLRWAFCRCRCAARTTALTLEAAQVPASAPLSRTATGVSLRPRPLRARPRGSARSRSARHLGYPVRVERLLAAVCISRESPKPREQDGTLPEGWLCRAPSLITNAPAPSRHAGNAGPRWEQNPKPTRAGTGSFGRRKHKARGVLRLWPGCWEGRQLCRDCQTAGSGPTPAHQASLPAN